MDYIQQVKTQLGFKTKKLRLDNGDLDWASDKSDGKSTSGCAVFYNGKLISWYSKKQASVALSTAEAEYLAVAQAHKLWNYACCCIPDWGAGAKTHRRGRANAEGASPKKCVTQKAYAKVCAGD